MNSYLPINVTDLVEQLQLIPHPEGGFFRETHRSGSVPMTSRGLTDNTTATYDASRSMVHVAAVPVTTNMYAMTNCDDQKSDSNDERGNMKYTTAPSSHTVRNALTSIYWVPTVKSPMLILGSNLSDHVQIGRAHV